MPKYDYLKMQEKWNQHWQAQNIYHPDIETAKNPFYSLYMFPYPSAEGLHVGHAFSGTGADVYARFKRMKGEDVFQPMGFDAFGIHSENFALKIGDHPQNLINRATKKFKEQFESLGLSYDWTHSVNTSSPDYYKWTQWLFIQLFNAGLAEKKKAEVNWCPSCLTVLADEQVIQVDQNKDLGLKIKENDKEKGSEVINHRVGVCERCDTPVERKELEQWFFKITKYADRLLEGLDRIDWTEKVKLAQRNWIGKSEGLLIRFKIKDLGLKNNESQEDHQSSIINHESFVEVFTTKPETIDGATFIVISPEHEILKKTDLSAEVSAYIEKYNLRDKKALQESREKSGVFTGILALNPVTGAEIPVWVSDYVLSGYGTGAIMAVPAADERDREFAEKFDLPIIPTSFEAKPEGEKRTNYHLRDWLISRQRYWGTPIPMINCPKDGWQAVPEADLPVVLPYIKDFKPLGTGVAPLAQDSGFVNTTCPKCGGPAKRETDVADTFLDSSWYFLRYPSVGDDSQAFDPEITKKWLPVNMYIGGAEHSVLHLLYSRFVTKVLHDQGLLEFDEPFTKFRAHGLIIKDGAKMSKSRGNVVNPDEYIAKYGADTLRAYLMFLGPFDQGGDFRDSGIEGMERFLKRVKVLVENFLASGNQNENPSAKSEALDRTLSKTVKTVGDDIENLRYNTSLAKIMELVNDLYVSKENIQLVHIKTLILLLAPFAPYMTEELWEKLHTASRLQTTVESVHLQNWPEFDPKLIEESVFTLAVQINGKLRATLEVDQSLGEEEIKALALENINVKSHLEGKEIKKVIYVPGKVLNLVV